MADRSRKKELSRGVSELWWLWVVQAIIAIIFGIAAVFWPDLTLVTLVYLIAPFVIVIGIIDITQGFMSIKYRDTWWMSLIIGLILLGVGVYLARHPHVSFATFILLIGINFILWGLVDIAKSFLDKSYTSHKTLTFISGLVGVAAGIIVLAQPVAGGLAFVWVIGLFALIYGISSLIMAIDHHRDFTELKTAINEG